METLLQDLRFAVRVFWRAPGLTLAILLAVALGIGANTAMFSVLDAVLLRPLAFPRPDRLVLIWEKDPKQQVYPVAGANFLDFARQAKSFEQMAGWVPTSFVLLGGDRPESLSGASVTANFFATLDVQPALGRTFLPDEDGSRDAASFSRVAVISDRVWRENFGADPNVLGRLVRLNNQQHAIVGVLKPDFQFINLRHGVWVPARLERDNRNYRNLTVITRLRADAGLPAAAQEIAAIAARLAAEFPASNRNWSTRVERLEDWLVRTEFRSTVLMLEGAVVMVLLLACANVANLLLARAAARRREVALRGALGAARGRIVRQLLTESVLISVAGGLFGLLLARWLVTLAPRILPPGVLPPTTPVQVSAAVLAFTAAVSVLTGLLFGLAPALEAARTDAQDTLREGGRGPGGSRAARLIRSSLAVSQVALATVLLTGSFLMLESLRRLTAIDLGFRPERVLTFSVFLPVSKYPDAARVSSFYREAVAKLRALPGVQAVATASHLPLQRMTMTIPFELDSDPVHAEAERPAIYYVTVDDGYLSALGVPVKEGRGIEASDNESAPPVVLVNEAFAKAYFPNQATAGKFLRLDRPILGKSGFEPTVRAQIVGVIGNVRLANLSAPAEPTVYVPAAQNVWTPTTMVAMRTALDPETLIASVRREIQSVDKDQPIRGAATLERSFADQFALPRFKVQLMAVFAGIATLLAVLGIYSVNAYSVERRRGEFGVRLALGATPGNVVAITLASALRQSALGAAIGAALAVSLSSVLQNQIFGVRPADPLVLSAVVVLLTLVSLLAAAVPAWRASRVDPMLALRAE